MSIYDGFGELFTLTRASPALPHVDPKSYLGLDAILGYRGMI
jgi:hypothetical protein